MMMTRALLTLCVITGWSAMAMAKSKTTKAKAEPAPNALTAAEKKAGWKLLFDGQSSKGWRLFKGTAFPEKGWGVQDGTLRFTPAGEKPGDIVTVDQFESFELKLDWRIAPGANSGIKYLVDEAMVKDGGRYGLSFEYQILDDDKHPDAKKGKDGNRTAGALYDLIAPKQKAARPPGEWNEARLVVDGNRVEHWLNGVKVVEFERGSPELKALIAESKYKTIAGFGEAPRGHVLLQEHGDEVAFRNIKIRPIAHKHAAK